MAFNFRARGTALRFTAAYNRLVEARLTPEQRSEIDEKVAVAFPRAREQVAEATGLPMAQHPFEVISRRTALELDVDEVIHEESNEDWSGVLPPVRNVAQSHPVRWAGSHILGGIAAVGAVLKVDAGRVDRTFTKRSGLNTYFPAEGLAGISYAREAPAGEGHFHAHLPISNAHEAPIGEGPNFHAHLLGVAAEEIAVANIPWLSTPQDPPVPIWGWEAENTDKFLKGYRAMARFWALRELGTFPDARPPHPGSERSRAALARLRIGDITPPGAARALSAAWVADIATAAGRAFPVTAMETPDHLPTDKEWRDPKAWITRVGGSGGRPTR